MNVPSANRPSIVRRAAIARGFEDAIRRNIASISRENASAGEVNGDAFRAFSQQVALATAGPCLRYSQRLQLINLAQRGGINRFDANLVIAAIEHHTTKTRGKSIAQIATPQSKSRALLFTTALAVQIAIIVSTWLALSH